jgi:hypothetical protein
MTNIAPGTAITADGEYSFTPTRTAPLVQVKGDLGGGTVTYGIVDAAGEFAPILETDGTAITTAIPGVLQFPTSRQLAISLDGGTEPDFAINFLATD